MATQLRIAGFSTITCTNLSGSALADSITSFFNSLEKQDIGLFYYSGHGAEIDTRNYLIGVDFRIPPRTDEDKSSATQRLVYHVKKQGFLLTRIFKILNTQGNLMNILILDACRKAPFLDGDDEEIKIQEGLAAVYAPPGTYIAFATAARFPAMDGESPDKRSLFTEKLLAMLQDTNARSLELDQLIRRVRKLVWLDAAQQLPWSTSSLVSDFVFMPQPPSAAITKVAPPPATTVAK